MTNTQLFFASASLFLSLFGLLLVWFRWRRSELRRDEVLSWADDCIEALQTLVLISLLKGPPLSEEKLSGIRLKIIFDTSMLIERGRLFFKNEAIDSFGAEKPPAYRGYRPRILDHLVLAHQIARFWPDETDEDAADRTELAKQCLKHFVSLAQQEVGRDRSASVEALKGGDGVDLSDKMTVLRAKRIA